MANDVDAGPAVDEQGRTARDPTANVRELVDAEIRRQDDLRVMATKHLEATASLRAVHARELREAETSRIDAIRQVDVGAVQRAAEVQADQATALATQVALSAETLRNTVAATAIAGSTALSAALDPIIKDIADLRRAQYEAQGRNVEKVDTRTSTGAVVGYLVGAVGVLVSLVTLVVLFSQSSP